MKIDYSKEYKETNKYLSGEINDKQDYFNKLIYKNKIKNLFEKDFSKIIHINQIEILGFHYHKENYNCLIDGKKYCLKTEVLTNIYHEQNYIVRNFDTIISNDRYNINFINNNIKKIEDFNHYNYECVLQFKKLIENCEINKMKHIPDIIEESEHFYIFKYYDISFYDQKTFFQNSDVFKNARENKIAPVCLGIGNIGYIGSYSNYMIYDIDLLSTNKLIEKKYIHHYVDNLPCEKKDYQETITYKTIGSPIGIELYYDTNQIKRRI